MLPDIIIGDGIMGKCPSELVGQKMTGRQRIDRKGNWAVTGYVNGLAVVQYFRRDGFCRKIGYL